MPEITTISAAITSVKNALDIVKAIREADKSLERAEIKLEITKLYELLVDAKDQTITAKEALQEKDRKITELEEAFAFKEKIVRFADAYYVLDEEKNPKGEPYCSHCWEVNHKAIHVVKGGITRDPFCPACKTEYNKHRAITK